MTSRQNQKESSEWSSGGDAGALKQRHNVLAGFVLCAKSLVQPLSPDRMLMMDKTGLLTPRGPGLMSSFMELTNQRVEWEKETKAGVCLRGLYHHH